MIRDLNILIVIPVYNHGSTLPGVVRSVLASGYNVLVVDDGSDDKCLDSLVDLQCLTVRFPTNKGKGAALQEGARKAAELGYNTIISIDADGQHSGADIPILVEKAQECDSPALIIGAREMIQETVPRSSHFGKAFSNFWVRLECGMELEDTQSGYRLYPVKELLQLKLTRSRYDFEIETIVKLAWAGIDILSVPVTVDYPAADKRISHFHKFKDNLRLTLLHSQLVMRRLLPWPHQRLAGAEPLGKEITKKVYTVHRNPLKTLGEMCREHSSPLWLAMAVWLGIFIGALPLLAFHTITIIYVAHRLHINKIAAVAASQLCMPPVVPVICIQTGYYMRHGELLLDLSWQKWLLEIHERLWEWLIGSLLVGPLLGLLVGSFVYWAAARLQSQKKLDGVTKA